MEIVPNDNLVAISRQSGTRFGDKQGRVCLKLSQGIIFLICIRIGGIYLERNDITFSRPFCDEWL